MKAPQRGEVWPVDLRLAGKVRPALVLGIPASESERALVTLVPHTRAVRETRFEVSVSVPSLQAGAFDAQNLVSVPHAKLVRLLGVLRPQHLSDVEAAVLRWLGFQPPPAGLGA